MCLGHHRLAFASADREDSSPDLALRYRPHTILVSDPIYIFFGPVYSLDSSRAREY